MVTLSAFADEISADPLEQVAVLERHGIRHIEFRGIHGKNVLDLSANEHEQFRRLLRERGFALSAIASPIGKIPIEEVFEPHLERFEVALELAQFYGTQRIRIFSFYLPEDQDPSVYRAEVLRRLSELTARARDRGLFLVLENEKGIYGDRPSRVADCVESIASPALQLAFDPANFLEIGESIPAAWSRLKPYVAHFHVKDYDIHLHRNVPAGEGQGEIARLIKDAVAGGFSGFCVLEPHLVVAEKSFGFTGPERFGDATRALKQSLDEIGVAYA
jgi:sugar phosphate isomerase/epimerase